MKQSVHELDAELLQFAMWEQLEQIIKLLKSIKLSVCPPEWAQDEMEDDLTGEDLYD